MSDKIQIVINGGNYDSWNQEQKDNLLEQLRAQYDATLTWSDIEIVNDAELAASLLEGVTPIDDPLDPYKKYWDTLTLMETLGHPRVYH